MVKGVAMTSVIGFTTEFKQIIGRGNRVRNDYGKYSISILDAAGELRSSWIRADGRDDILKALSKTGFPCFIYVGIDVLTAIRLAMGVYISTPTCSVEMESTREYLAFWLQRPRLWRSFHQPPTG